MRAANKEIANKNGMLASHALLFRGGTSQIRTVLSSERVTSVCPLGENTGALFRGRKAYGWPVLASRRITTSSGRFEPDRCRKSLRHLVTLLSSKVPVPHTARNFPSGEKRQSRW